MPDSPLAGLPLDYLIALDDAPAKPDRAIGLGYDAQQRPASAKYAIKYGNLYDQTGTGAYGPYLPLTKTAKDYGELVPDPAGVGFWKLLDEQIERAKGWDAFELDNRDAFANAVVLKAFDRVQSAGLGAICKNPLTSDHGEDATELLRHSAVVGCVVEKDAGGMASMEALRRAAGKPDLPIWFVFFGSSRADAIACAAIIRVAHYVNMGVTYSTQGEYESSEDILIPIKADAMTEPREAKSLLTLRDQIDALAPGRDKSSDGTLGDRRHQGTVSDHNPDSEGVIRALDITHDPAHGVDTYKLADLLRANWDDRVQYLISNHRIANKGLNGRQWRPYHGTNPHDQHVHISVVHDDVLADDTRPWQVTLSDPVIDTQVPQPRLKLGDHGTAVVDLQKRLGIEPSGNFDAATVSAVEAFQASHGLEIDGIVGPYTWRALNAPTRQVGIITSIFAGSRDPQRSAYDRHLIGADEFAASLPYRFVGAPPRVRVFANGRSAIAAIEDVGPWNINDPYWLTGTRPQAETGTDRRGRKTNRAGIDLTSAMAHELGLSIKAGLALVDWEFIDGASTVAKPIPPPPSYKEFIAKIRADLNALEQSMENETPAQPTSPPQLPPPQTQSSFDLAHIDFARIERALLAGARLAEALEKARTGGQTTLPDITLPALPPPAPASRVAALGPWRMLFAALMPLLPKITTLGSGVGYGLLWLLQELGVAGTATGTTKTMTGSLLTMLLSLIGGGGGLTWLQQMLKGQQQK